MGYPYSDAHSPRVQSVIDRVVGSNFFAADLRSSANPPWLAASLTPEFRAVTRSDRDQRSRTGQPSVNLGHHPPGAAHPKPLFRGRRERLVRAVSGGQVGAAAALRTTHELSREDKQRVNDIIHARQTAAELKEPPPTAVHSVAVDRTLSSIRARSRER